MEIEGFAQEGYNEEWTTEEEKCFKYALAVFDMDTPDRWVNMAAVIPTKTVIDVIRHYEKLVKDVCEIEVGRASLAGHDLDSSFTMEMVGEGSKNKPTTIIKSSSKNERKKTVHWTEEEHSRFLEGLLKCGKGRWRDIAHKFVFTKTPTQVASHAQKFFIRQNRNIHDMKRRASIHDITTLNVIETITTPDNQNKSLPLQEAQIIPSPCDQQQTSIQEMQPDEIDELLDRIFYNIDEVDQNKSLPLQEEQIMPSPYVQQQTSIQEMQPHEIDELLDRLFDI